MSRFDEPLYRAWKSMHQRCYNPREPAYKNYGGRGIKVCWRWFDSATFEGDMAPHPGDGYTLDRIDNDGNYEPDNCRWATRKTQARNRRNNKLTEDDVRKMRAMYAAGEKQITLSKIFDYPQSLVCLIVNGKLWV